MDDNIINLHLLSKLCHSGNDYRPSVKWVQLFTLSITCRPTLTSLLLRMIHHLPVAFTPHYTVVRNLSVGH